MNLETLKMLYAYTFWAHDRIRECVAQLSEEQYFRKTGYAWDTVHGFVIHLMAAELTWFSRFQGVSPERLLNAGDFDSREAVFAKWDETRTMMKNYLDKLTEDDLKGSFTYTNTKGVEFTRPLLAVLLHVVNHGTDTRAGLLAVVHQVGGQTFEQDFIFYMREQMS